MGVKRKFEKTVTDQRGVDFSSGKYAGNIAWTNGKRDGIWIKDRDDNRLWLDFKEESEMRDLRDLLNALLEEIKEVPKS